MSNCNSCPSKNSCKSQATCNIKNNPNNNIKKIIIIKATHIKRKINQL